LKPATGPYLEPILPATGSSSESQMAGGSLLLVSFFLDNNTYRLALPLIGFPAQLKELEKCKIEAKFQKLKVTFSGNLLILRLPPILSDYHLRLKEDLNQGNYRNYFPRRLKSQASLDFRLPRESVTGCYWGMRFWGIS
jgi:hypothetical protein